MTKTSKPAFRPSRRTQHAALCAVLAAGALALAACESRIGKHGNLPDPELLAEIKTGASSREQVAQTLGTPSSMALFDLETWFYISETTETDAFFEPEVIDRKVLILKFNKSGILAQMAGLGLEDSHDIEPIDRVTPTAGNEVTILDQLLGNVGRFNKGAPGQ